MSAGRFTLGDALGAKTVNCRVRGCKRTWLDFSSNPKLGGKAADGEARGLCEPCAKKLATLVDEQRPCARPGCTRTWTFPRQGQLEAFATTHAEPPHLCLECEAELAALTPKDVACVVPGCTRTATLSPRQQLVGGIENAMHGHLTMTGPMCAPCSEVAGRIETRKINCGVHQCKRHWIWPADEQIVAFAAGKPSTPPRRLCVECRADFGKLTDRQVRCRASGCKLHWTWTREDQLDAAVADKPLGKPPAHLCERCFGLWNGMADVERPCRQHGCKKTWTDNRGAQLARAIRGKTGDPYPQYCSEHASLIDDLEDREIGCKTDGCNNTWTWSKNQQLAAGVRPEMREPDEAEAPVAAEAAGAPGVVVEIKGSPVVVEIVPGGAATADGPGPEGVSAADVSKEQASESKADGKQGGRGKRRRRREIRPPGKHCERCAEFLGGHKTIELPCAQCGTAIFWPPESQLQTDLGNWEIPKLCGACKRDVTEAERKKAREELRQQVIAASEHARAEVQAASAPAATPEPAGDGS